MSIFSLLGAASEGLYWTWFIAAGYGAIALIIGVLLALISFFDVGDTVRNAAAGMVAGAAVGALVLTVTCFINLSTVGSVFE